MGGFRSSKTSAIIAAASVLGCQTSGAHATSQHLRQRNLQDTIETRDYEHLGCFKDSQTDRILGTKLTDDENVTADFCYDYCATLGAPFMATQWGIECWCATDVEANFGRHGEGAECDYPCAGDKEEMCGGYDAVDLYLIGSDGRSVTPSPITPVTPSPVTPRTPEPSGTTPPDGSFVEDIVKIIAVTGRVPGGASWADSYSVGGRCYMYSNFDHDIGGFEVETPKGLMTIRELYGVLGPGPGHEGRPLYNDIQCGNGPANTAADETDCPGLVDYGRDGCGQIGPMWDLSELE